MKRLWVKSSIKSFSLPFNYPMSRERERKREEFPIKRVLFLLRVHRPKFALMYLSFSESFPDLQCENYCEMISSSDDCLFRIVFIFFYNNIFAVIRYIIDDIYQITKRYYYFWLNIHKEIIWMKSNLCVYISHK